MINAPLTPPPSAIFRAPLGVKKPGTDEHALKEKNKNTRMAYVYLGLAMVLLLSYSVYFFYPQAKAFIEAPATLASLQEEAKHYDEVTLPGLTQTRDLKEAAYNEELTQVEKNINTIFPGNIDKLGLVKRLENFATAIDSQYPPFEFNSITFEKPVKGSAYTILPISTSIHSSRANFDRLIELVNLSGQLDSETPIRLMEISNVSIRYRGVDATTGKDNGVDFTVKLNAYSR